MTQLSEAQREEIRAKVAAGELEVPAGADERAAVQPLEDEQVAAFLAYVEEHKGAPIKEAALAAGIRRRWQIKQALESDPALRELYDEARGYGPDAVRREIDRRAIEGVDEPVFHNGVVVGHVRRYSDRLLALRAKATLPEYRDTTTIEIGGRGGGAIQVEQRGVTLVAVAAVLEAAGALRAGDGAGADRQALPAAREVLAESVPED